MPGYVTAQRLSFAASGNLAVERAHGALAARLSRNSEATLWLLQGISRDLALISTANWPSGLRAREEVGIRSNETIAFQAAPDDCRGPSTKKGIECMVQ